MAEPMKIVYDVDLRQPGCVLLQAAMGGTVPNFSELFITAQWIVAPSPGLRLYEVTQAQLEHLATISKQRSDPPARIKP